MSEQLVYLAYAAAALGALAVYVGLPKERTPARRGLLLVLMMAAAGGLLLLFNEMLDGGDDRVAFCVLALLGVGSAVRVVTHANPVYSALYFILVVLSTAALLALVGAEFLWVALVAVYAGAILVTYVFVIMLAQQSSRSQTSASDFGMDYDRSAREPAYAVLAGFALMATVSGMILRRPWPQWNEEAAGALMEQNTLALGKILMTDFAVSVELAGVLLMVAMIGAIAVARRRIPAADGDVETRPPGEAGRTAEPF